MATRSTRAGFNRPVLGLAAKTASSGQATFPRSSSLETPDRNTSCAVPHPSGTEEHKPDDAEDQNGEPGRGGQERQYRRPGFALARLGGRFHNAIMFSRCSHG